MSQKILRDMIKYKFNLEYALLHLNYNCNLHCEHCRVPLIDKKKGKMPFDLAKNIIDQLAELKVSDVTFTGGEPSLYGNIIELVKYCVIKGISIRLQTNFANIDSIFLDNYCNSGGHSISVSLDGLEKTHDAIRGKKGLFEKIISLVSKYNQVITFQVDFVLSKINYLEIYALIDLLIRIGVKIFSFRTMVPSTNISVLSSHSFSKHELYNVYNEIYERTKFTTAIKVISPDPLFNLIKIVNSNIINNSKNIFIGGCSIGLGVLSIQPNADVLLCSFINEPIGNLRSETLKAVIKRVNKLEIVKKFVFREGIQICSDCNYRFLCGGCRARALEMLGDFNGTDPLCFKDFMILNDLA